MDVLTAVRLTRFCIGLLLLWAMFYLSVRSYLVDHLRQKLFAIRDDLFDFAADDGVAFDDPAYVRLRQDLNNLIRFAHKVSMFRLVFAHWVIAPEISAQQQAEWKEWLNRVEQLPPLAKRKLMNVRVDALREVMFYIFRRSLFLLVVFWLVKVASLWLEAARVLTRRLPSFAEPLEAQARDEFRFAAQF